MTIFLTKLTEFTIQHFCKNLSGDGVRDLIGSADLQDIFYISMSFYRSDFWRIITLLIHECVFDAESRLS
ncbi:hypothetical protein EBR43_06055 [bacterium]|nr:hypothetical protein [bacterium]